MKIETASGKVFDIRVICKTLRNPKKLLIELEDNRTYADIEADFSGLNMIKTYEADDDYHVYEGYSKLIGIQHNEDAGTVRITLKKEE